MLVDDHPILRDGLAALLVSTRPGWQTRVAGALQQAIAEVEAGLLPDIVFMDLGLPDSQGVETIRRFIEAVPEVPVVVLSADERPEVITAAIDAGAVGFIPKTADWSLWRQAVEAILQGRVFVPPIMQAVKGPVVHADLAGLSPRQLDVLKLIVAGKSNKHIAKELDLAVSTVKTHVAAIFDRLGVSSRTQALVASARLGLEIHPWR